MRANVTFHLAPHFLTHSESIKRRFSISVNCAVKGHLYETQIHLPRRSRRPDVMRRAGVQLRSDLHRGERPGPLRVPVT